MNLRTISTFTHLAYYDLKGRFAGQGLGAAWSLIQPLSTLVILVFVFEFGLKISMVDGNSFSLWLTTGMLPWFFFQESTTLSTSAISDYSHLVKKRPINHVSLPLIKTFSALIVHLALLFLCSIYLSTLTAYGLPNLLLLFYFIIATSVLSFGVSLLISANSVFIPDVRAAISVVLQVGMWATPILWELNKIPEQYHIFFKLNPVYYLVTGYRAAFLNGEYSWSAFDTAWFWGLTIVLLVGSYLNFKRLSRNFADAL